jgi:hypothetical protein
MCVPVIHVNNNPAYNLKRNTYKSKKERNEAVLKISEIVTEDIIKHSKFNIPYGSVIVIKDYIQPQIINPEGVVSYVYKCSKWNYDDGVFIWDLKKACPLEYYDEDEGWFNRLIVPPTFEISDLCTILTPISYFNTFCLRRVEKSIWFTPEILHRMFFTYEKVYTKHEGKIVEDDFEDIMLSTNEQGEIVEVKEKNRYKVFNRIYLSLQEDEIEFGDDFDWAKNTGVQPNYNGHPQGVVYLRDHDEIDEFCDIIETYNGGELPRGNVRENLHNGLEYSRDELEGDDYDPSNAVLSASFFVEKNKPSLLSVGYWGYDVDDRSIFEWLEDGDTFNNEYELYTNLNQVKKVFEDYQNPELVKESTDPEWEWLNDVPDTVPFETVELHKKYKIEVTEDLRDAIESCGENSRMFVQGYYGVATRSDIASYNRIHCDSEIEDETLTLLLSFYDIDDKVINFFWVTPNMVDFYEI